MGPALGGVRTIGLHKVGRRPRHAAQYIEAEERLRTASCTVAEIEANISSRILSNSSGHAATEVVLH